MKFKIAAFLLISFFIFPLSLSYAQVQKKHVLILNSYHKGFPWSDNVMKGIGSVFKKEGIEVHTEYMDTKRIQDERHFQNLFELYKHKFFKVKFDVIITSDDNAFKFLLKYRDKLFPDIPVVFCGVNNFKDSMLIGHKGITGVAEDIDIKSTIDIALKLHPKAGKFYVIGDRTKSGRSNKEKLKKIIPGYQESINFVILDDFEARELKERLNNLPDDSIVLFFNFFRDRSGKYFSLKDQMLLVGENTNVPVYTCWAYRIKYGVFGGMVVNGFYHGRSAADMALRILKGEKAGSIPVLKKSPNKYMFEYRQLRRFNILLSQLPEGSIITNRPSPFYQVYKGVIWITSTIIVILILSVLVLINIIESRRRREKEIRKKANQLESLYELGKRTTSIISIDDLLPWITEEATNLLNADACYYRIREGNYLVHRGNQKGLETMLREKIKIGEGLSGCIAKEKEPITISDNYYDDARHFPEHKKKAKEAGFQSCLGVPMKVMGRVVGVLVVLSKEPKEYTEEEVKLLSSFADQAAIALENAKLFKELKQKINDHKRTGEALGESERRLVEAQKIARVGDWDRNFKDDTSTWSDEVYRIFGISKKSYDGTFEAFLKMVHPEDRKALKEALARSLSERKPLDIVFRIVRSDGTERIVNSKGEVSCDYSGEPVRMFGTVQDVTGIKKAEEKIKKSLKEKELLLKEIHHRVKNNMQVISSILVLQSALIEDENTSDIFKQCQDRIKSMGMIHDRLYQTEELANIDFKKYTKALTDYLLNSYGKSDKIVSLEFDIEDIFLDIDTAVPLSLIMNELITNALKYAFRDKDKGQINISLREIDDSELLLSIKDDGIGLPKNLDIRNTESLGLEIVSILAEKQLKGKIDIAQNGGTEFQVTFKRKQLKT